MDYQEARAAFFAPSPPETVEPAIVRDGGAARRLRDAIEPLAMHAVWCARTNESLAAAFGLDFLGGYVWGRASALGEPAPAVVVSAFAVFAPALVAGVYEQARSRAGWAELVATRDAATSQSLRELLGGEAGEAGEAEVAGTVAVLRRGIDAADRAGRPMFAGLAGRAWTDDPYGQLWRACDILREHRGDSHVAAFVAAGLDGIEMNILTELWLGAPLFGYSATRGWPASELTVAADRLRARGLLEGDALSADGHRARAAIEDRTDAAQDRLIAAIGDDLDAVTTRLARWSATLVAAGAFPPSIHKRAAG